RMTISGVSLMSGANGGAYGLLVFSLKDWADRPDSTISPVLSDLYRATANMKEGRILFFTPPTVSGFSVASGFELQLQDRSGKSIDKFAEVTDKFMEDLGAQPEIASVSTSFDINYPQEEFEVNVDKCKLMGVNVSDVFNTMQIYYGSAQASDFNRFTKYYRVMVQSDASSRENKESLSKIMVRNNAGVMVPINTLVSFKRIYGAESLKRFNLFTAATINGTPAEGYSSGDAIAAVERVAAKLPTGYGYEFSGMTREEKSSGGQSAVIFLLCFIFVYLILSAQYESYILPWAVMLSLIIGVFGVYFFVWLVGLRWR
ncbi:MAG: efflux RND transporter permease subunit, partial [Mucinivorans sp.]